MEDRDFIDFEFNGHWASEFNLLAVSNSDRYSNSFYGTVNANTADMVGKYGVYKWKTQIGEKRFSINIAYDNVDLNTLRKIKEWLNPFVIGKLVFKEEPYKYYWVSLAEDPEISFLPFLTEETVVDGRRLKKGVYKGEFVINFVCFDNYGYSDWNSFDENYDYIVKELEISDDEVNFDDGSDNSLIISQIDGNLKQNKESQAYYSTSQESNRLTLNNITNTDTEKWSIKGGNSQVVQNYNSIQVEGESFNLNYVDNSKTMDIQLKGNHSQETREGYNLLDFNNPISLSYYTSKTFEKDTLTISCTKGTWQYAKYDMMDIFEKYAGQTMSFQVESYSSSNSEANSTVQLAYNDGKNNYIQLLSSNTFTIPSDISNITKAEIGIYANNTGNALSNTFTVVKPMLVLGTEAKPYEQYGASPSPDFPSEIKTVKDSVEVKVVNKNLLSKSNVVYNQISDSLTVTNLGNGRFLFDGKNNGILPKEVRIIGSYNTTNKAILLKKGSYEVKTNSDKIAIEQVGLSNKDTKSNPFTIDEDMWLSTIKISVLAKTNFENENILISLQTIGSGEAEERREQTITMPVQQEMLEGDYAANVEHHEWRNLVLTGTEALVLVDIYQGIAQFEIGIENSENNAEWRNDDKIRAFSNYYRGVIYNNSWIIDNCITTSGDGRPRIMTSQYTTVDSFKAFLKSKYDEGNPVIVYYKLATPVNLKLTSEQKTAAKQFKAITPYKNITHIYSTDKIAPKMVVDYNITREMPSLDYPSEVETVGGNINIFNKNDVMENAYLNSANGSTLSSSTSVTSNYIEINSNSNYVINGYGTNNYYKVVCYYDKNKNFISSITKTDTRNELEISAPDGACYLRFHISKNSEEVKLEKGSIATPYSKYGTGSAEIDVVNKNLFPSVKSQSVESNGIALSYNADTQEFHAEGTTTSTNFYCNMRCGEMNFLKANKNYIFSVNNSMVEKCLFQITRANVGNNGDIQAGEKSVTIVNLDKYIPNSVMFYSSNIEIGTKISYTFKVQIEEGTTATDIVEHQSQSYIMPIQQDMLDGDYFDFDREKEVHNWGKYIFTGEERIVKSSMPQNNSYWINQETIPELLNAEASTNTAILPQCICTHFKTLKPIKITNASNVGITINANNAEKTNVSIRIGFGINSEINTADKCKSLLKSFYEAGNPVIFYYKLSTLTQLDFTNEQKTVARKLKRSNFYKGTTNVILDNDLAKVKVNYDGYDGAPSEKHPSSIDGVKSKVDIIISNQNLFNFNKLNTSNSNLTIANNKLSGNNSVAIIGASNDSKGLLNKILVPGTYTVSFDILSKTDNWINSAFLCCQNPQKAENYANGISVNLIANEKKRASFQFEVKEKMTQFGIVFYLSKASEYEVSNITMVKGTEEDYIEYKQQQISLPVQEEMYIGDYIDEIGEHHKMVKIVIDGTNTRVSMTKKVANFIQTYLSTSEQFDPQVDINCYSNIMKQEYNAHFGFVNTFIKSKTGIYFHFKSGLLGDADCNDIGMNNWFKEQYDKGTPAYIIGPLKKEKVLPLTDEQKSALNILKNYTYSYPGANTISISGDTKPKITASYIPQQDINIDFILEGSNLLNDSAFYYNNDIYLKAFDEIDSGNPSTSGISSEREVYLYNAGNADASLKLTFDLIIPAENSPLTIVTSKGHFTKNGFEEINSYSQFSISNFAHYKPFVDIFDGVLSNWVIEIDSDLCEVYLKHKTNKDKVISLNRFNDNQSFLKLAGSDFVDYSKFFPTSLEEIKDSAIENTIFNKISLKESAQNYRLKNVSLDWKHTYL